MIEVEIVEDIAEAGERLFLDAAPRTVALAGGQTPRALYERLAATAYDWEGVEVFFGDERCVPPDDAASNFKMANETLLSKVGAHVHPMCACDPLAYEAELGSVFGPGVPRFDLVLLGLGDDGHTASLFPGDPALGVTDRSVVLVDRSDHRRMTLTLPVLSAAKLAVFLVQGERKRDALAKLIAGADIPSGRVRAERTVVLADAGAAGTAT